MLSGGVLFSRKEWKSDPYAYMHNGFRGFYFSVVHRWIGWRGLLLQSLLCRLLPGAQGGDENLHRGQGMHCNETGNGLRTVRDRLHGA
jgi:hypothetical protein